MPRKKNKYFQKILSFFLRIGAVLSMSFLAFAGLYFVCASLPWAIVAFVLSGFIEWKVFGKSIDKGFSRLKLIGGEATKYLLALELQKYLEDHEAALKNVNQEMNDENTCKFLQDYSKALKNYRKTRSEEDKKALDELRTFFLHYTLKQSIENDEACFIDGKLAGQDQSMLSKAKRNVWLLRFFFFISIIIGAGSAIVTAYAIQTALLVLLVKIGLVLSATALLATVWPIAIIAGIGGAFLFYYTMTDIIKHDVLRKSYNNLCQLLKREIVDGKKEPLTAYIFRIGITLLVMAGIIALTLFATVATAGTWLFAIKAAGVDLLPKMPMLVNVIGRWIIVGVNAITDVIYGVTTTLQTMVKLKGLFKPIRYFKDCCNEIKHWFSDLKQRESLGQLLNPFRIITNLVIIPFELVVFLGHVISVGLTTDRLGNLNPIIVAIGCAIPEGLQDANFLLNEEKTKHHTAPTEEKAIAEEDVHNNNSHLNQDDSHDDHDDHDHGGFLTNLLKCFLSPLLFLSGLWHWAFKKEGDDLTLKDSLKQAFGMHDHNEHEVSSQAPLPLSEKWEQEHRPNLYINQAIERLSSVCFDKANAKEKQEILKKLDLEKEDIFNEIKKNGITLNDYLNLKKIGKNDKTVDPISTEIKPEKTYFDVLNKRRTPFLFKAEGQTTTMDILNKSFCVPKAG